jgi:hypothetical protein
MISDENKRFILTIPKNQLKLLKRIAYIDDSSVAEVMRLAIKKYTDERKGTITDGEIIKEFWGNAVRSDNGCLEWQGATNGSGYGTYKEIQGETATHRISYKITYGDIPEKLCVCHKCDNPLCVDPEHLFIGTHQDNFVDMRNKGRQKTTGKKLNGEMVAKIIRLYYGMHGLKSHHLAKKFDVGLGTISKILTRKSWITAPEVIEAWKIVDENRKRIYGE